MGGYGSSEILLLWENILQHTTLLMHYGMLHAAFLMNKCIVHAVLHYALMNKLKRSQAQRGVFNSQRGAAPL